MFNLKEKGMTMIEMLVVIAITGILTAIVMGSITTSRSTARDNKRLSDLKEIQFSLAIFNDVKRAYPESFAVNNFEIVYEELKDYGLNITPVDPQTEENYSYFCSETGMGPGLCVGNYCLGAKLERESAIPSDNAIGQCGSYDTNINYWLQSQI